MSSEEREPAPGKTNRFDVRVVARKALLQLLEPLTGFVLDSGLSAHEMHSILREAAVRSVAARQLEVSRRVNISGIAASTGIPRAEISRILRTAADPPQHIISGQQQSTNRILAAWHQDPKFTTPSGQPADLKIYGRGATFEALVRIHGRGIPTRAMLDELTRTGATEVLPSQLIRVKTSLAIDRGITPRVIKSFGDRASELLATMLQNMRNPEKPQFIGSIAGTNISSSLIPLFRKEVSSKGSDFLADMQDALLRVPANARVKRSEADASRVSVTIFYHEVPRKAKRMKNSIKARRNFRRSR